MVSFDHPSSTIFQVSVSWVSSSKTISRCKEVNRLFCQRISEFLSSILRITRTSADCPQKVTTSLYVNSSRWDLYFWQCDMKKESQQFKKKKVGKPLLNSTERKGVKGEKVFWMKKRVHWTPQSSICYLKYGSTKEFIRGIWFIVLYPPRYSHDLPPLAGLYTQKLLSKIVQIHRTLKFNHLNTNDMKKDGTKNVYAVEREVWVWGGG